MTNTTAIVAPLWGMERMLGTNPIAIAFPGRNEPPIVIDMATCTAAYGKIEMALRRGEKIPEGWATDNLEVKNDEPCRRHRRRRANAAGIGTRTWWSQGLLPSHDGGPFEWRAEWVANWGAVRHPLRGAANYSDAKRWQRNRTLLRRHADRRLHRRRFVQIAGR